MAEPGTQPARLTATVPMIDVRGLLQRPDALVVDLRTPREFDEDHLPGARNLPLLSDAERAVVGLLYKQASPAHAFDRGLEFVQHNIGGLVGALSDLAGWETDAAQVNSRVAELAAGGIERLQESLQTRDWRGEGRPVVLHCWRGGLRSQSVVALLQRMGFEDAVGLEGGYKAYRAGVREEIHAWRPPPTFVLRGLTGVGKTLVLRELERMRPEWTLDLEGIAGHRSSLLGMVGLQPVSQKAFESGIAARIRDGFPGPLVVEGESRRVGDAIIPQGVWGALRGGDNILLEAGIERRIDVLIADYLALEGNRGPLRTQLAQIEDRMGNRLPLVELLDSGHERELVRVLLDQYYDPLYRHGERAMEYVLQVDAADERQAARRIASWVESRPC